jgi:hypothetical protein
MVLNVTITNGKTFGRMCRNMIRGAGAGVTAAST